MPPVVVQAAAVVITGAVVGVEAAIALGAITLLNVVTSKLTAPDVPSQLGLNAIQLNSRSAIERRKIGYGTCMVGGPIFYNLSEGAELESAWFGVALLEGESNALNAIWINGKRIAAADIDWTPGVGGADGTGTGDVTDSEWQGEGGATALRVRWYLGHPDQVASSAFVAAFADITADHRGRGVTFVLFEFINTAATAQVWENGQPQKFQAEIEARKVYDRRRDALNADPYFETVGAGGTGGDDTPVEKTRWYSSTDQSVRLFANQTPSGGWANANGELSWTDNDNFGEQVISERIPVDTSKGYTVSLQVRQTAGDRRNYLGVAFFNSNGDHIDLSSSPPSDATGWGSIGSPGHYFGLVNQVAAATWTTYSITFGVGGTATIPTGAVEMCFYATMTRDGAVGTSTDIGMRRVRIRESVGTRHDPDNGDTWEFSDNPANCVTDYMRQVMSVDYDAIDWPAAINAAQACDETVPIPTAATEKRFTCNGALSLGDTHRANLNRLASSAAGTVAYKADGTWKFRAGIWDEPSVSFDEGDIISGLDFRGSAPERERWNSVRGFFLDPDRNFKAVEFPHQIDSSLVARDNKPLYKDIELPLTNSNYMAQRVADRVLWQGDQQKVLKATFNMRGAKVSVGDVATLDLPSLDYTDGGNIMPHSENVTVSPWVQTRLTAIADQALSPFGTLTADEITETTDVGEHYIQQSPTGGNDDPTQIGTFSCYVKAGVRSRCDLYVFNHAAVSNYLTAEYDFTERGQVISSGALGDAELIGAGIQYAGNGWFRIWITGIVDINGLTTDGLRPRLRMRNETSGSYTGVIGANMFVYGFQYEYQRAPTRYKKTDTELVTTAPFIGRCVEWQGNGDFSFDVTFREDDSKAYDDPLEVDYATAAAPVVSTPADVVPAPTNLAAGNVTGGIELTWDNPPAAGFDYIEVYESATDQWSAAALIAEVRADAFTVPGDFADEKYYWIRAVRSPDARSLREPNSDTSTVSGEATGGASGVSSSLTQPAHVVSANSDGTGYSLTNAGGTHEVIEGQTDRTTSATHSVVGGATKNGLTMSVVSTTGVYSLSGASWTSDEETFTLRATFNSVNYDKTYTITKAKNAAGVSITAIGADLGDVAIDPDDAQVRYRIDSDGDVYTSEGVGAAFASIGTWLQSGLNSDYQVRFDVISGDTPTGSSTGVWLAASADRTWQFDETSPPGLGKSTVGMVKWRNATTLELLGQADVDMQVDVESGV